MTYKVKNIYYLALCRGRLLTLGVDGKSFLPLLEEASMALRHPVQNPGHGQGYLSQDSRIVPPPAFADCRCGSAAAQSEQERLTQADSGWGPLLQCGLRKYLEALGVSL